MRVYDAKGTFGLGGVDDNYEDFNADVLFTHFDTWMGPARKKIPSMEVPYVSYVIVDHDPAPQAVVEQVNNAHEVIAMSEYAAEKLSQKGVRPLTIPHGVNTDVYRPLDKEEMPEEIAIQDEFNNTRTVNVNDEFIFGMIAANHGDRKNIPNHLEAFKMFLDEVDDDAILYVHTKQNSNEGFKLESVMEEIGIPHENIMWPSDEDYGSVGNEYLNGWYNAFDVLLNVSMGESWGLTITEAQAAGTPCIVTNFTSMPEQLGVKPTNPESYIDWLDNYKSSGKDVGLAPHGIVLEPDGQVWRERVSSKQYITNPETILQGMKFYYHNTEMVESHGEAAREYVVENYDWNNASLPKFRELFNSLETIIG